MTARTPRTPGEKKEVCEDFSLGVLGVLAALSVSFLGLAGCEDTSGPPPQTAQNQPPPAYGYPPPPGYGQPPYAPPTAAPPMPPPAPPGPTPAPQPSRPLLGPLVGPVAWQAEARSVMQELVANLSPDKQRLVATIPLVIDPNPGEVNAFAGCDDGGAPFVAGTEGLLEAVDAIAQTKATDELYGTRTYDAYANLVAPRLVSQNGASAMLPAGVVPAQVWLDPRRLSRSHEIFDEIVAFTFGHELSHHYLGHTGCANGQPQGVPPAVSALGRLLSQAAPVFNQPNEIAADNQGTVNALDAGRARSAYAYRWNEEGALWLLDFFARLDSAAGAFPIAFNRTHPNPGLRIPLVQAAATAWRFQHPG